MSDFNKHNFNVARFVSQEASRYTLQAIQVTPEETIATDGHMLVRCDAVANGDQPALSRPFLLSSKTALNMAKETTKTVATALDPVPAAEPGGPAQVGFRIPFEPYPIVAQETEGTFPNVAAVIPSDTEKVAIKLHVNPEYLERLAKFFKELAGGSAKRPGKGITLTIYEPKYTGKKLDSESDEEYAKRRQYTDSAVKIEGESPDGQKALALLMPMRP